MNSDFIYRKFRGYYSSTEIAPPQRIEQREFGIGREKKIDTRHLSFKSQEKLNFYLRSTVPFYISYSAAYYEFPDARPMENKNWLGSDLVFDLDTTDLDLHCKHPHDMVCRKCMKQIAIECSKLVNEFLRKDFGFEREEIKIVFSGNRGFHVHVVSDAILDLSQEARKKIVDYITAEGVELAKPGKQVKIIGPTLKSAGWGGRVALALYDSIRSSPDVSTLLKKTGLSRSVANILFKNKQAVLEALTDGKWSKVKGLSLNRWNEVVVEIASKLRVNLDKNVTTDMARLMRLPGSLHGGTGLVACEVKDARSFDALSEPVVFGEELVEVVGRAEVKFELNGKKFKITEGEKIELPEYAAVYAACKNLVVVNE